MSLGEATREETTFEPAGYSPTRGWQLAINYNWNDGHVYQATPEQLHQRMMGLIGEHPRDLGNGDQASMWHRDQITGTDFGLQSGFFSAPYAELPWPPARCWRPMQPVRPAQPKPTPTTVQPEVSETAPRPAAEVVEPVEAIVIGPPQIGDFLRQMKPKWNFLPDVAAPGDLMDALMREEVERWPEVVFIVDEPFLDPTGSNPDMVSFLTATAPDALVAIVSYHEDWQQAIVDQVVIQADNDGYQPDHFYFVDADRPQATLEQAIIQFNKDWQRFCGQRSSAEEETEDDKWRMERRQKQIRRLRRSEFISGWNGDGTVLGKGRCTCGHIQ